MSSNDRRDEDPAAKGLQEANRESLAQRPGPIHDDERAELEAANHELQAQRARASSKTNRHGDDDAPFSRLQRLAAEASEDDDQGRPTTVSDPQTLEREVERLKTQIQEHDQTDREQREQRTRERAAASVRNKEAMQAQREADTSEAWRRVEEARERAARKNSHDAQAAATDRKRTTRKRRRRKATEEKLALPTERELLAVLMKAETDDEICAAVAKWCWITSHDGDERYADRIPRWNGLIAWWNRDGSVLNKEEHRVLSEALGTPAFWSSQLIPDPRADDARAVAYEAREVLTLAEVHRRWMATTPLPLHPLVPMVDAWQQLAPEPERIANKSVLIMSRSVAQIKSTSDDYYLSRFQPAIRREPSGQLIMDLTNDEALGPTLPANIWTMGLASAEKRGAVIPLALRIWVASILHTPLSSRHGRYPVQLEDLTLRRFLAWVYTSKKVPKPVRYWSRIMAAREVINTTELPFEWRGNLWSRPVVTLATPLTRPGLDDPWPVTVHLPPGNGTGPAISFTRLQHWSVRNGACYRALINLAYRWHIEGKRMMPAAGGKHWLQIRDPRRYDRITDATADALCYPPGTGAKRRDQRVADAHAALEELVKHGDAVAVEGRLLPPPRVRTGT